MILFSLSYDQKSGVPEHSEWTEAKQEGKRLKEAKEKQASQEIYDR